MVVMNESFSDLTTYLEGYETSTDPMPYVRSLMKRGDVVSGTCAVSSDMGTGTANSEFEFFRNGRRTHGCAFLRRPGAAPFQ